MQKPFILITNDDGIHAPGIKQLWNAVSDFADTAIVAPLGEKSGSGVSITFVKPLHVHEVAWENNTPAWSMTGTPADCVKMALSVILPRKPDLILSGINRGSNAGRTVLYSGTVGGIIEGTMKGIPGIAFSFCDTDEVPASVTKKYIPPLVRYFLTHTLPNGSFLNVNFPLNSKDRIAGFRFARQGHGYWIESPDKRLHPDGMPYYWLGGKWLAHTEEDPESDVSLLEQGFVTGVPIHVGELTDHTLLKKHKNAEKMIFS